MASNVELMLEERILGRTGRRVRDLAIEVAAEGITLHGRTETYHVKQLALSAIREALPQMTIINGIEVE
jgi:pyridoxine 5'-phosphate synthase PdxJ